MSQPEPFTRSSDEEILATLQSLKYRITEPGIRHVPPLRLVTSTAFGPRPLLEDQYLYNVTQSELVVAHPALETAPPVQPEIAQLTITAPITIGCGRVAQVVACTVVPQGEGDSRMPFKAAAKIYDPLYYRFSLSLANSPRDTTWEADGVYSREAAAYEHLERAGQTGSFAPKYYGSWTFSLPIASGGGSRSRPIHLVLIEHLNGTTIRNTFIHNNPSLRAGKDAFHYPEEYRLRSSHGLWTPPSGNGLGAWTMGSLRVGMSCLSPILRSQLPRWR
ncbi:hypothetical protein VMCG_10367 [Cytospora schulzeri]|uniref:Uncharacterized protein n=1 Tax=Cytospora schulzeri TaxID=448051 RepID=A0A423VCA0_9PEZI|nr:hypothetical protein VMCG_10367 [Valsa malicola]